MPKPSWDNPAAKSRREGVAHSIQQGHLGGTDSFGEPSTWFPEMWEWLIEEFKLKSMLDIGCGIGLTTNFFHESGLDVMGVDGADDCIRYNRLPDNVIQHDFNNGPYLSDRKYDLVWSTEFLEHVEQQYVPNLVESFVSHTDKIMVVTASRLPDGGYHHVNAQEPEYWIDLFTKAGLKYSPELTAIAKEKTPITGCGRMVPLFEETGMIFLRK